MSRRQRGLGAIAAIMVLVILAALAAGIVAVSTAQQMASAQDVLAARAWQVASAGTEGGLFRALQNAACDTQTWASIDDPAFRVTVACAFNDYNDGETSPGSARRLRVFRVVATACNGGAATCPDNAASGGAGYVERQRVALAYCQWTGLACAGP